MLSLRSKTAALICADSSVASSIKTALAATLGFGLMTAAPVVLAAPPVENTQCILGQPGAPSGLNCTANDVALSSPQVTVVKGCDFPGDTARLQVLVDVEVTAQTRYDASVWLSVDGDPNGDGSASGICSVLTLPNNILDVDGNSTNLDGDACGDVANTAGGPPDILNVDLGTVDLLCDDPDGDGLINVPVIISWDQQSANNCAVSTDSVPGSPSKCVQNNELTIPVPVPGRIIVNKSTTPQPDATQFGFNISGPDSGIMGGFDGSYSFLLADGDSFDSGDGTLVGGIPAGDDYAVAEAPNSDYISVGTCSSDIDGGNTDPSDLDVRAGETITCNFTNTLNIASLTIEKQSVGGTASFDFTGSGSIGDFSLDTASMNPDSQTFLVTPGIFTITETPLAGYDLTSLSCTDGKGTPDIGNNQITDISLVPGDVVTCTFVNSAQGTLSLTKIAIGGDDVFGFVTNLGSPNSDDFDITTTNGTGTAQASFTVPQGDYNITENSIPMDWSFVDAECRDGNDQLISTPNGNGVDFTVVPNTTIACTFRNVKSGTIVVEKVVDPAPDATDFTFTSTALPVPSFDLANGESQSFTVATNADGSPEAYGVVEADPAPLGYELTDIVCATDGVQNDSVVNIPSRVAAFRVKPGETVTCTFTNTKLATLTVEKVVSGNFGALSTEFDFTSDFGMPFSLDPENGTPSMQFTNLQPGVAVMVSETDPTAEGWTLIDATCGDGGETVNLGSGMISNIVPEAGEDITCTFTNAPLGSATIVKNAVGGDDVFGFTGSEEPFSNGGNGFQIDTSVQNTADFTNQLLPDILYDVQEDVIPDGWTLTSVVCTDATNDSAPDGTEQPPADPALGAFIVAAPDETVTCTFTNEADANFVVVKETIPASDITTQFAFTGSVNGSIAGGEQLTADGLQGAYTADETPTDGWVLTNIACTGVPAQDITIGGTGSFVDGDTDVSVAVEPGETATCTYTNTKEGSITIVKNTVGAIGSFTFQGPDGAFNLDTDPNTMTEDTEVFSNLLPDNYMFSETVPTGWQLTDLQCVGDNASMVQTGSDGVSIDLADGEDITCTFVNTAQTGTIFIDKVTVPSGSAQSFDFTLTGTDVNEMFALTDAAAPNQVVVLNSTVNGTYNAAETLPQGWTQSSAVCDDGSPVGAINVAPDETVTCTFTNTIMPANILVDKVTDPSGSAQSFDFTLTGTGVNAMFALTDGDAAYDSGDLIPTSENGTYSVAETLPTGWDQTSAVCSDGSPIGAVDLEPGETVTCTFTNTIQPGRVLVDKVTDPSGSTQSFDFSLTGTGVNAMFALTDAAAAYDSGDLLPTSENGTYSVVETLPQGWDQTSAVCSDGSPANAIDLAAGETITCTFTNTVQPGFILVDKVTDPSGSSQSFAFTLTGTGVNQGFNLTDGDAPYNSGPIAPSSENGTYNVAETLPTGWDQTSAVCSDGSPVGAVDVAPGETVTCTFTNTVQPGNIVVTKTTDPVGSAQGFDFTLTGTGVNQAFSLGDGNSHDSGDVLPSSENGTYSIVEAAVAGWELLSATCDNGSPANAVVVEPGETVTCAFVNGVEASRIIVAKVTDPAGSAQSFDFTLTGGDLNAAFALTGSSVPYNSGDILPSSEGGTYNVSETLPDGWDQTSAVCDDGSPVTAVDVAPLETVRCTFTNTIQLGTIIVDKVTDPTGSTQAFDFTLTNGVDPAVMFSLADGDAPVATADLLPSSESGTYSITEAMVDGWDMTSAVCDDGSPADAVDLAPGETVTCVFTNTIQPGNIVVDKVTMPTGSPQSFDFTLSGTGVNEAFSLTDAAAAYDSGDLVPTSENGTYSIVEAAIDGWTMTDATCDDGSPVDAVDIEPGETVTCTFTNTQDTALTVVKVVNGGTAMPADFILTLTGADGTHDGGLPYMSGDQPVVEMGVAYTLSETADQVEDYFQDGDTVCVNNADQSEVPHPVTLDAGDEVTCTITNTLNEVAFGLLNEVCSNDTPFVDYDVTTTEGNVSAVTITWIKNDGSDEVVETIVDADPSGSLLWPGAAVDMMGNPIAWPGWSCDAEGNNCLEIDDGLRPTMQLRFEINPTETVVIDYPPATPACDANPAATNPYVPRPVPVDQPWALLLMLLSMLGMGWYFRPQHARIKR